MCWNYVIKKIIIRKKMKMKNNNLLKFHISGSYVVYVQSIINARSNNIDTKPVNTTPSFLVIHKQHLSGHCGHIVDVSLVILKRSLNLNWFQKFWIYLLLLLIFLWELGARAESVYLRIAAHRVVQKKHRGPCLPSSVVALFGASFWTDTAAHTCIASGS